MPFSAFAVVVMVRNRAPVKVKIRLRMRGFPRGNRWFVDCGTIKSCAVRIEMVRMSKQGVNLVVCQIAWDDSDWDPTFRHPLGHHEGDQRTSSFRVGVRSENQKTDLGFFIDQRQQLVAPRSWQRFVIQCVSWV